MLAFIVQARLGSTRLPNKIILPFYNGKSIFELLLEKLSEFKDVKCIVATTTDRTNDVLESICDKYRIACYRGDENDVLQRFIDAATEYNIDRIVRVCSDNPFLNKNAIEELLQTAIATDADYVSFNVGGVPSIKTHYGFWTEYVRLDTLERVKSLTNDMLYHEHVTNYIYSHPGVFKIEWLGVPSVVISNNIRLTIDTQQDFNNARLVYEQLGDEASIEQLFAYIKQNPIIAQSMQKQIADNTK